MWLYIPTSQPSPSPPEPPDLTKVSDWWCQAIAQSCTWRGKHRSLKCWQRAWKKATSLRRLSGRTLPPSTAGPIADAWLASQPAIPVSPFRTGVSDVAKVIHATFGRKSVESLSKLSPTSSSSRTSEGMSLWGIPLYESNYKAWATELHRDCLRRRKRALLCFALDSSSSPWPNPLGSENRQGYQKRSNFGPGSHGKQQSLTTAAMDWSSPIAHESKQSVRDRKPGDNQQMSVTEDALNWTAPRASSGGAESRSSRLVRKAGGLDIVTQATDWMAPSANDHKRSTKVGQRHGQLTEDAECLYSLPADPDATTPGVGFWKNARGLHLLSGLSRLAELTLAPKTLNPFFDEWLMGWPPGWTAYEPLATESIRFKLRMLSYLFGLVCGTEDPQ